jgi:hypothetical protein
MARAGARAGPSTISRDGQFGEAGSSDVMEIPVF